MTIRSERIKSFSHTYFSDIVDLNCTNIFKMNPAQKAAVAIFAVVIMSFYLANVEASPRIRSMRVSNIKYYEIVFRKVFLYMLQITDIILFEFLKGMPLWILLVSKYFYELDLFNGQYQISKIKENSQMIVKNAAK